jgi:hypothetical protein
VDKTEILYQLAQYSTPFFLGRPRRFGKSLLLSTLKAYFEGKKELFRGLAMEGLEKEWTEYPVLYLDLDMASYRNAADLELGLDAILRRFEEIWDVSVREGDQSPSIRFYELIYTIYEKTGRRVVVLVDEYDKPYVQAVESGGNSDEARKALINFYGILKSADQWLRFVFITGILRLPQDFINSGINQLWNISMNSTYADLCGISMKELETCFEPELRELAARNDMTYVEVVTEIKKQYDGYHFCENSEGLLNPFSILSVLSNGKFADYWYGTGSAEFLIKQMKHYDFDVLQFEEGLEADANDIGDCRVERGNIAQLLYHFGYLTIMGYDRKFGRYVLNFPNREVRYRFLKDLLPYYTYGGRGAGRGMNTRR